MRLLKDDGHGNVSLVEHGDDNIPRYAILSHTWGADSEEVTYKDLLESTGKNKAGYNKIEFCRKQATSDGLQHFWVDTCCIDKSSSAELTEAINSMFRWYQNAFRCYVYLSDVSTSENTPNPPSLSTSWEAAFRGSRWFSRGWTLQELIAPSSVDFFSREGDRLGSKGLLEQKIHEITGIAMGALRGGPLMDFEVEERLSWTHHRDTKRPEDKAYSLLGIFNVHMPLLYGEGRENAFVRLREKIGKSSKRKWDSYAQTTPFAQYGEATLLTARKLPIPVGFGLNLSHAPEVDEEMFVGRQTEVTQLGQWLTPRSTVSGKSVVAIVGLGGLGKTQLSITFAKQHYKQYSSIFWLNAKDELSLKQEFVHISQVIGMDQGNGSTGPSDEDLVVQQVLRWLSRPENDRWLLIFDNYDDPRLPGVRSPTGYDIRRYFPSRSQGSILITTRSHRLTFARPLKLTKLQDLHESIKILSNRSGRDLSEGECL
jgi:Heterokaryon incompatibility protein (HET)/NB-ARC domain